MKKCFYFLLVSLVFSSYSLFAQQDNDYIFTEQEDSLFDRYNDSDQPSGWSTDLYIGTEQELDFDMDGSYRKNSAEASPYIGAFIYNPDLGLTFDIQYLMGFSDNSGYFRNRFTFGFKYNQSFEFQNGQSFGYSFRVAYRHDTKDWSSSPYTGYTESASGDSAIAYVKVQDQRNEAWLVPTLNYDPSKNWSLFASFSFRLIHNPYKYLVSDGTVDSGDFVAEGNPRFLRKGAFSTIQEHNLGMKYTFDNKSNISLSYLLIYENLSRAVNNFENVLLFSYSAVLPNSDKIMPYLRLPIYVASLKYYNWDNEITSEKQKLNPRVGIQYNHFFTEKTSLMFDFYYRPESTWDVINGKRANYEFNNFYFFALELTHRF